MRACHHPDRQSPTQQPLGFDYDEGHAEQGLTALAGIPVLLQAFRSLDLPRSVERHVSVKQRQRGLDEASYVVIGVHCWAGAATTSQTATTAVHHAVIQTHSY